MISNFMLTGLLAATVTHVAGLLAPHYATPSKYEDDGEPPLNLAYQRPRSARLLQPAAPADEAGSRRLNFPRPNAPHGFQFSNFRGPVSGAIEEVEVPYVQPTQGPHSYPTPKSHHPAKSFDYKAKPDYAFTFGVQDPESGNAQARQETRDGDTVQGEYTVMEPDGVLRTVIYSADPINGFQARVKYGPSGLPPPPPPTPTPTSGYTGVAQQPQPQPKQQQQPLQHRFKVKKRPTYSYEQYDEY